MFASYERLLKNVAGKFKMARKIARLEKISRMC